MTVRVSLVVALPSAQEVIELELRDGATAGEALAHAAVRARYPDLDPGTVTLGIWARPVEAGRVLRDGDRVEVYRPLKADAKAMRRERARLTPAASPRSRNEP